MLYHILYPFAEQFQLFNLFRYITFRSAGAILTSMLIVFLFMPCWIKYLKQKFNKGQPIREDGPQQHLAKQGTPSMGGVVIIASLLLTCVLWGDLHNSYLWLSLFVTLGCAGLGFADDYLKLSKYNTKGVPGKIKMLIQGSISIIAVIWLQILAPETYDSHVALPFFKDFLINLGWFYIPFVMFVLIGASNAVNLTDGLDGLAIVPIIIASSCFALIAYLVGSMKFSTYLHVQHVEHAAELSVFCSSIIGAGLGFLWYNAQPAEIMMGDVGSLSLGGAIGITSVITKHEITLAIIGGLFVLEALSVIIQVYYFKLSGGKRFFKMAPLHHHFEKEGWSESKVVIRFWILAIIFAILGLATLKIR